MINHQIIAVWTRNNALYARAAAALGVGYPELMVLYALQSWGELTQKQIAENFGMQKQTVHSVVSALQKQGRLQLKPCEGDRREKRIVLTESGREYADRMIEPLRRVEDKIYEAIGCERLQAMCTTVELFNLLFEKELNAGLKNA